MALRTVLKDWCKDGHMKAEVRTKRKRDEHGKTSRCGTSDVCSRDDPVHQPPQTPHTSRPLAREHRVPRTPDLKPVLVPSGYRVLHTHCNTALCGMNP